MENQEKLQEFKKLRFRLTLLWFSALLLNLFLYTDVAENLFHGDTEVFVAAEQDCSSLYQVRGFSHERNIWKKWHSLALGTTSELKPLKSVIARWHVSGLVPEKSRALYTRNQDFQEQGWELLFSGLSPPPFS